MELDPEALLTYTAICLDLLTVLLNQVGRSNSKN